MAGQKGAEPHCARGRAGLGGSSRNAPTTVRSPCVEIEVPKRSAAVPSDATSLATSEKPSEAAAPRARTRSAASARWRPMVRWWCVMGCEAQAVVVVRGAAAEGLRRRAAGAGDDVVVVGWGGSRGAAVRDVHGWWCGARRGRRGAGERRRPGGARRGGWVRGARRRRTLCLAFRTKVYLTTSARFGWYTFGAVSSSNLQVADC